MVIEILDTNLLKDEKAKKIMVEMNNIGNKITKHGFELTYAGTGNLYYSLIDFFATNLKNFPKLGHILNEFSKKILQEQIKKGNILIYYPPDWVYTREQY